MATITEYLQKLPIVWLSSNPNGQAAAAAEGSLYDSQVDLLKQAVKCRMPNQAPADALPSIGSDRQLIQGAAESDITFRLRCQDVWAQWALAGTWAELLFQLYFTCGLEAGSAFIVQQNGQAYSLTGNPGPTDDPTTLLQITSCDTNPTITYPTPTPWWTFDMNDSLCARFALIIASPIPQSICHTVRVTFTASGVGVGAWAYPFDGATYSTMTSVVTTDGSIPLVAVTAQDAETVTVTATAPFTGYVDVIGWTGSNPFASPTQSMANLINTVCNTWKPAKALFMGTWAVAEGWILGFPIGTKLGDAGLTLGDNVVSYFGA